MNIDDLDREDEGWIWLPWEELERLQAEKTRIVRMMMNNASLVVAPLRLQASNHNQRNEPDNDPPGLI